MRIKALVLATALLLGVFINQAFAASSTDPNDTPGRLDITFVRGSGSSGEVGRFRIETQRRYRCRYLRRSSSNRLKLLFDDRRDGDVDLVGRFKCSNHDWILDLKGPDTGSHYESLSVKRPNKHTVKVKVPLFLDELSGNHMGIYATSKDATAPACATTPCKDRAPDSGTIKIY